MDKLPNLKIEADGEMFETSSVIASVIVGIALRTDKQQENVFSFVIKEGTEHLLIEVDKKNMEPLGIEPKCGMLATITGQLTDDGMQFKGFQPMQIFAAEQVSFTDMNKMDGRLRTIFQKMRNVEK